MANKKSGYVEPVEFFPPEARKLFEKGKTSTDTAKKAVKKPAAKKKSK